MINTIETGYKPEFALGALYQGQNAANAQSANTEDLIRAFLANQHDVVNNPIIEEKNKEELDPLRYQSMLARFKMDDPNYIPAQVSGQIGQMQTQEAAGKTATALQPFKQAADQAQLEIDKNKQETLWTIQDIDKKLTAGGGEDEQGTVVPFNPMQRMFMQNKRAELVEQLKSSPEFAAKKELSDDKIEAQLEAQRIRSQGAIDAAEAKTAQAQEKALNDKQLYARALMIVAGIMPATEQEKIAAAAILDRMQADAVGKNAALTNPTIDFSKMGKGVPMTTSPATTAREQADKSMAAAQQGKRQLSAEDQQAKAWSLANLTDPRAKEILKRLAAKQ